MMRPTRAKAHRPRPRRRGERGMTLVEIMVVVVIISLMTAVVGVSVFNRLEKARRSSAYIQVRNICDALELYKLSLRNYPSTAEGLQALVNPKGGEKPFMASIPKDPWGQDYVYLNPGIHNPNGYDVMSYGPDQVQGGDDDIGNWENGGDK